ncbi:hypothetical protein TNCV_2632021 [Trichonephila clavipes]|nr:hypothetical protein TNCV_2632021 [Trichonephila clavipes]
MKKSKKAGSSSIITKIVLPITNSHFDDRHVSALRSELSSFVVLTKVIFLEEIAGLLAVKTFDLNFPISVDSLLFW